AWGPKLRLLQRRLGEVHDLDVLRSRILRFGREHSLPPAVEHAQMAVVESARKQRMDRCEIIISRSGRSGAVPRRTRARSARPLLWNAWHQELDVLVGINLPESEAPSTSATMRSSLSAARRIQRRGRRLLPSSAK